MFRRIFNLLYTWIPVVALMALTYYLSSQPDFGGPGWASAFVYRFLGDTPLLAQIEWMLPYLDRYISWIAHFVEFGLLAVVIYRAIRRQWPDVRWPFLYAWLATVSYGVLDEWHQSFVPSRHPDIRDIFTDAAGAAVTLGMIWGVAKFRAKTKD